MRKNIEGRCIKGVLSDSSEEEPGIQPECVVSETWPGQEEVTLGECDNLDNPESSSNLPCYTIREDADKCVETITHLRVDVHYEENATVPPDTMIRAYCIAE